MLRTLSIRDFVIVDHIELEFSHGFSVLTGETGAGKSILIDALSLTMGGRGDASMVREGTGKADICAEFAMTPSCRDWLTSHDLETEDDMILLRRVIDNAGRSKAWINGVNATAAQLREIGSLLVDIHGQHAHQTLLNNDTQRQLLDSHARLTPEVAMVTTLYKKWHALRQQRTQFEANTQQVLQERERLEWQYNELDKLRVLPDEWQDITNEHSRLSHAASLIEGAQFALHVISESEDPILSQLASVNQKLTKLTEFDEALKSVMEMLEPARIHLQEATSFLNDYVSRVELDPERLRAVEERVDILHSTARKYHVNPEQLPELTRKLGTELAQLGEATDLNSLLELEQTALELYLAAAKKLTSARQSAADMLSTAVTAAMQELSMTGGSFAVALNPVEPCSYGLEQCEFMVAGHAGVAPRPLAKVASGGELSRLALAISVITSASTATPTLIFDEVDSGIGGGIAEVVGRLLKRLGQDYQVLCVTHLPQVASQANHHFQVSKSSQADSTISHIAVLDTKARIEEIARMLGGLEITATTRKHAKELLAC